MQRRLHITLCLASGYEVRFGFRPWRWKLYLQCEQSSPSVLTSPLLPHLNALHLPLPHPVHPEDGPGHSPDSLPSLGGWSELVEESESVPS